MGAGLRIRAPVGDIEPDWVHQALGAAYSHWVAEMKDQDAAQAEIDNRKKEAKAAKSREQSEKSKKKEEVERSRREANMKKEKEMAKQLGQVKEEGQGCTPISPIL